MNGWISGYQPDNYSFKVSNRSSRNICEICSKLTLKTQNIVIDVSIDDFEYLNAC